jgi:hypothetical protein
MSESGKIGDGGKADQKARQGRRLAAALRENLKRRKAQAKGRSVVRTAFQGTIERSAGPHDSAGIADDKQDQ